MVGPIFGVSVLDLADAWVLSVHVLITGNGSRRWVGDSLPDGGIDETRATAVLAFVVAITHHDLPEGSPWVSDSVPRTSTTRLH